MVRKLKNLVGIFSLIGIFSVVGCTTPVEREDRINSSLDKGHIEKIMSISKIHGGMTRGSERRDYDGDGLMDDYVVMKDGLIYYLSSRDILTWGDKSRNWGWYKVE